MDFLFVFLLGLAIGSFINCAVYRVYTEQSMRGTSFCPHCRHSLFAKDLVPLLSWVFLFGRCRYCKEKISVQYPLVELAVGLVFLSSYLFIVPALSLATLFYLFFVLSLLSFVFVYDLKYYIIPDFAVFSLIGIALLYRFFHFFTEGDVNNLLYPVFSALGAFVFFFLIFYLSKGKGMGFGDVKYVIFMGLFLGFPEIIVGLFLSFSLGAIIGLILLTLKKKGMKSEIPFGPFLITGTILSYFFGDFLVDWYFSFII